MRINKNLQNGILFCLYVARAGRANTQTIAENLGLSRAFLEQIARKLRLANVVHSVRGPGGGYELIGNPTVMDVMRALDYNGFLKSTESEQLSRGNSEHRALAAFVGSLSILMNNATNTPLRNVVFSLARAEARMMDSATESRAS